MSQMRYTSMLCYQQITHSGLLGAREMEVYRALAGHGPCTVPELWAAMGAPSSQSNIVAPRINGLASRGVVCELPKRLCGVTGRMSIVWEVANKMPQKPERRVSRQEIIEKLQQDNRRLNEEIERLNRASEEALKWA